MATSKTFGRSQIVASDAIHDYSCSPCSEDGKNSEALYHCSICQAFYCQRCVDVHNKFSKNHKVTDKTSDKFGHGLRNTATSSSELPTDVCEEHHGKAVEMFCQQHDVVCCTVCIAVKHRSCKGVEYIPAIARGLLQRQGKDKTKHSLEKIKADLKNLKSKMEDDLRHLDKQRDDIIDNIQAYKKRIIARVEELERKSLKEVKSKHKDLADDINSYSKKIGGLLKIIDIRLNKLAHSTDNNEAQQFVDVKNGEKESCEAADLVKQATPRNMKTMTFEMNTGIDVRLSKEQSLGFLKECTANQACVNIVCPVETDITNAFVTELQTQLKNYDIQAEFIKLTEIVADHYTIVLFENGSEDNAVKNITSVPDHMIMLMNLKPIIPAPFCPYHYRNFKASFIIDCEDDAFVTSFQSEENLLVYKSIAKIVKE